MAKIMTKTHTIESTDAQGNTTIVEDQETLAIEVSREPDFIKLYTRVYCEFNEIPNCWRALFFELVSRMSYCNKTRLKDSQVVHIAEPTTSAICDTLGWKNKSSLRQGLRALCQCNAIRRVGRGAYQINPNYAAKGEWKYNPRLDRGGVEDLIATFNFRTGAINTQITWTADKADNDN